jgi:hypothetical protein
VTFFTISYPDLVKFHYFAETSVKEGIGGERMPKDKGDFKENSIYLLEILVKKLKKALGVKNLQAC